MLVKLSKGCSWSATLWSVRAGRLRQDGGGCLRYTIEETRGRVQHVKRVVKWGRKGASEWGTLFGLLRPWPRLHPHHTRDRQCSLCHSGLVSRDWSKSGKNNNSKMIFLELWSKPEKIAICFKVKITKNNSIEISLTLYNKFKKDLTVMAFHKWRHSLKQIKIIYPWIKK